MSTSAFAPGAFARPAGADRLQLPDTSFLSASVLAQAVMTIDGRPIVLVDMDGVIAKWLPGVIRICGELAVEACVSPTPVDHVIINEGGLADFYANVEDAVGAAVLVA